MWRTYSSSTLATPLHRAAIGLDGFDFEASQAKQSFLPNHILSYKLPSAPIHNSHSTAEDALRASISLIHNTHFTVSNKLGFPLAFLLRLRSTFFEREKIPRQFTRASTRPTTPSVAFSSGTFPTPSRWSSKTTPWKRPLTILSTPLPLHGDWQEAKGVRDSYSGDSGEFHRPKLNLPRSAGLVFNGEAQFSPLPADVNQAMLAQLPHKPLHHRPQQHHAFLLWLRVWARTQVIVRLGLTSVRISIPTSNPTPPPRRRLASSVQHQVDTIRSLTTRWRSTGVLPPAGFMESSVKASPSCVSGITGEKLGTVGDMPDCGACSKVESSQPSRLCYSRDRLRGGAILCSRIALASLSGSLVRLVSVLLFASSSHCSALSSVFLVLSKVPRRAFSVSNGLIIRHLATICFV